jgi:hypothetical protein
MSKGKLKDEIYREGGNMLQVVPDIIEINREKFDAILDEAKTDAPRELKEIIWYSDDDVQEMRKWFKEYFGDQ